MTKILLVEDDKNLREIYGVRLGAEGYQIVTAGDGEEALAVAIKERPDLIISDVMMPKISGFDMLDILKSTTETKNIKVIMMTALSSDEQRARGEALGANKYLVKSQVGIEDVVRCVHEVLADNTLSKNSTLPNSSGSLATNTNSQDSSTTRSSVENSESNIQTVASNSLNPQSAYAMNSLSTSSQFQDTSILDIPQSTESTNLNDMDQKTPATTSTPLLGDKVIEPMPSQVPSVNIADLMNQELKQTSELNVPQQTPPSASPESSSSPQSSPTSI
ncbi:response regulator [bacterium]|nr:response regulator [bacterium]